MKGAVAFIPTKVDKIKACGLSIFFFAKTKVFIAARPMTLSNDLLNI